MFRATCVSVWVLLVLVTVLLGSCEVEKAGNGTPDSVNGTPGASVVSAAIPISVFVPGDTFPGSTPVSCMGECGSEGDATPGLGAGEESNGELSREPAADASGQSWFKTTAHMNPVKIVPGMGVEVDSGVSEHELPSPGGIALVLLVPAGGGPWSLISAQPLTSLPPGVAIENRFASNFYRVIGESGRVIYERPLPPGRDHVEWLDERGIWHAAPAPRVDQVINVRLPNPSGVVRLEVLQRDGTDKRSVPVFSVLVRGKR